MTARSTPTDPGEPRVDRVEIALVAAACAIAAALGLLFVFARAPHPWGWEGIDHYDEYGRRLARGEPYGTLDRIWGYPVLLAIFYRLFAFRVWPVLMFQIALNAAVPAIMYAAVRERVGRRVATIAALLIGTVSLNTVYASTQAADSLCTIATVAGIVVLARVESRGGAFGWAAAGLLLGVAGQFRPNVLLLPPVLAAWLLWRRRASFGVAALFVLAALVVDVPWIVRNERVSGRFIPATTHGGLQLWYGSVQVPPYYEDWTRNPAAVLEANIFNYSREGRDYLIIDVESPACAPQTLSAASIAFRTGTSGPFTRTNAIRVDRRTATFTIPRPPRGSTLYYYVEAAWHGAGGTRIAQTSPLGADTAPFIHFVADDDLHDLDANGDLLDAYDIARLIRHLAWRGPLPYADRLDLDEDGIITSKDLDVALATLTRPATFLQHLSPPAHIVRSLDARETSAIALLQDGSTIEVPKAWTGAITDVRISGGMAADAVRSSRSLAELRSAESLARRFPSADSCLELIPSVDRDFAHREPQADDRYRRLAWAEITRAPWGFAAASLRRTFDLFVISGPTTTSEEASKGSASRRIYQAGRAVTGVLFALLVGGGWLAWRRGASLDPFWVPIVYLPLTICYLLANMRYTVTVQPFEFVFVAIALDALWAALIARASRRTPAVP